MEWKLKEEKKGKLIAKGESTLNQISVIERKLEEMNETFLVASNFLEEHSEQTQINEHQQ
jgi:hypothetical protein